MRWVASPLTLSELALSCSLVQELRGETSISDCTSTLRFRIPFLHQTSPISAPMPDIFNPNDFIMRPCVLVVEPIATLSDIYQVKPSHEAC